jgi:hypothetical protein
MIECQNLMPRFCWSSMRVRCANRSLIHTGRKRPLNPRPKGSFPHSLSRKPPFRLRPTWVIRAVGTQCRSCVYSVASPTRDRVHRPCGGKNGGGSYPTIGTSRLVRRERRRHRPSRCFEEKPFPSGAHNLFHIPLPLWRISPAGFQQLHAI